MSTVTEGTDAGDGGPERRRPPREEVRRALLDAAAQVFARQGVDGASVGDVAAAAGFTKGAVYSNFGSKDDLVAALVEDRVSAYLELGLDAVSGADTSLGDKARALGDRLTRATDEQRDWQLLFLELWQRAMRSGAAGGAFVERRRALHAAVTEEMAVHLERAGAVPPFRAAELATLVIALSNGLALERQMDRGSVPDDLFGRVLELVVGEARVTSSKVT